VIRIVSVFDGGSEQQLFLMLIQYYLKIMSAILFNRILIKSIIIGS
jgi:hypothetical protein